MTKSYGWRPDLPDHRDHRFSVTRAAPLPPSVDLRPLCPPVYDQGDLGSCEGNSIAGAVQFERARQGFTPDFIPSRLFIYYNTRVKEGTAAVDAGASLRDGIKSVAKLGVCPETEWPYDITQFATRPNAACYTDAIKYRALTYLRVAPSLKQMRGCLAAGYPFVFGFSVYESFESVEVAATGIVPMPMFAERQVGGHACLCVGYDTPSSRFIARNSWGGAWGQQGYFTIPFEYLLDHGLSGDFWTIRLESA